MSLLDTKQWLREENIHIQGWKHDDFQRLCLIIFTRSFLMRIINWIIEPKVCLIFSLSNLIKITFSHEELLLRNKFIWLSCLLARLSHVSLLSQNLIKENNDEDHITVKEQNCNISASFQWLYFEITRSSSSLKSEYFIPIYRSIILLNTVFWIDIKRWDENKVDQF